MGFLDLKKDHFTSADLRAFVPEWVVNVLESLSSLWNVTCIKLEPRIGDTADFNSSDFNRKKLGRDREDVRRQLG